MIVLLIALRAQSVRQAYEQGRIVVERNLILLVVRTHISITVVEPRSAHHRTSQLILRWMICAREEVPATRLLEGEGGASVVRVARWVPTKANDEGAASCPESVAQLHAPER